ncbi:MAG: trypsin-like peptidase domain-containing protein [Acidimicrobiales bacterium]
MRAGAIVAGVLIGAVVAVGCGGATEATTVDERPTEIRAWGCGGADPAVGSGTAIDAATVLTVAHVVAGADSIIVTDASGAEHDATVAAIDTDLDLAVLDVPGLDVTDVELASLGAGDRGTASGLGTGGEFGWTVERTVVIRFADIYGEGAHDRAGYELDATVERGDSGAGLFADDGSLGGVVFAASRRDSARAWATDIAAAEDILDVAGEADPAGREPAECVTLTRAG